MAARAGRSRMWGRMNCNDSPRAVIVQTALDPSVVELLTRLLRSVGFVDVSLSPTLPDQETLEPHCLLITDEDLDWQGVHAWLERLPDVSHTNRPAVCLLVSPRRVVPVVNALEDWVDIFVITGTPEHPHDLDNAVTSTIEPVVIEVFFRRIHQSLTERA
jgi:hypothetical protein